MKLVSWNVNGLRAVSKKDFTENMLELDPAIIALQEIKIKKDQLSQVENFNFDNYFMYCNSADKPGYSGTMVMSKIKPLSVVYGIENEYTDEGRVITLEYKNFFLVNVYVPNSQRGLKRLDYRMQFEDKFREYLMNLDKIKPVILCGDLNVAHQEIDLKNPKTNTKNPGFTTDERDKYTKLLNKGFVDTFRYLYPEEIKYTWWSYMFNARKNNAGWRIDYFVVSKRIMDNVKDSIIYDKILGSDHCPVMLELKGFKGENNNE